MRFRDKPFEERQTEYNKISRKYKDKIPVIVEPYQGDITTTKFLVDESIPFCEFMFEVRKKLQLKPEHLISNRQWNHGTFHGYSRNDSCKVCLFRWIFVCKLFV